MKELKLYYRDGCPYCKKVVKFLEKNPNLKVEMMNVADEKNFKDLVEIGGMDQVPMMTIDGKPMYESGDIVKFLKEQLA